MIKLSLCAVALVPLLWAQNPYGRIVGRVTDPTGAVVPGAGVRVVNTGSNVTAAAKTNAEGNYEFPSLLPGAYRLEAEATGFKHYSRGPLEVRVGDVLEVAVAMEVGGAAEQVTVSSESPLLESATSGMGQVIDNQRIVDLPIAGGNPLYLTQLTPGVIQTTSPGNAWLPQGIQPTSNAVVAGTNNGSSEFLIDGAPNMSRGGMVAFSPPPEMVQEFRVQTAPYDASVGHFSGASINIVLKSGTNGLHGAGFASHVSRPLMTKPFFVNKSLYDLSSGPVTQEKIDRVWPNIRTNRFRGTAGGPLYIPKVYDGRNRTFWTFGIDKLDRSMPEPRFMTVPSQAQRSGDFSALLALGSRYQIYDPYSIATAPNQRTSRQPLARNVVPASRQDPIAQKLIAYYALPNIAADSEGRNNYFDPRIRTIDYKSEIARVDHQFNPNHRMYASLSLYQNYERWGNAFHNDALGMGVDRFHRGFILDDVFTPTATMVLNARYGFTRLVSDRGPQSTPFDLGGLGFPASLIRQLTPGWTGFPNISIDGTAYTALGDETFAATRTNRHVFSATLWTLKGNHAFRFGGEWRAFQGNDAALGNVSPSVAFNPTWTRGPFDNSAAAPIGQGMASLLYGLPSGGFIEKTDTLAVQSNYGALFFHDDWKIGRSLTLNAGLRWEIELPLRERYNRMNRGFDFTAANPIQDAARTAYARTPIAELPAASFRTSGGLLFAGRDGVARAIRDADANNFSPRIGLAWKLGGGTVLRGGYGIFFVSGLEDTTDAYQLGYTQPTNIEPSLDNGLTYRATLANPFPDPLLPPPGAARGLGTFLGSSVPFIEPAQRLGYMQRFTFGIQRQFGNQFLAEIGYMGNRASGLGVPEQFGATPARYLSTLRERDQPVIDNLSTLVSNPFFGMAEFTGSNMTARTVSKAQLLSPYPQFNSVTTVLNRGAASFNALLARLERRFARGYTLQAAYTWSKNMDASSKLNASDRDPVRVISALDRTHRVTTSGVLELPFGRGRRWASNARGVAGALAGGWSIQGIYIFQTGQPLAFGNVLFRGDIKEIELDRGERSVERWFNVEAGFERDTRRQLASNIRTFPMRFSGVRGPGIGNIDLSLFKTFRISERIKLQFRAEGQNALNHAIFPVTANSPGVNPTASTFGQITQGENEQRRITLALKLMW